MEIIVLRKRANLFTEVETQNVRGGTESMAMDGEQLLAHHVRCRLRKFDTMSKR